MHVLLLRLFCNVYLVLRTTACFLNVLCPHATTVLDSWSLVVYALKIYPVPVSFLYFASFPCLPCLDFEDCWCYFHKGKEKCDRDTFVWLVFLNVISSISINFVQMI